MTGTNHRLSHVAFGTQQLELLCYMIPLAKEQVGRYQVTSS